MAGSLSDGVNGTEHQVIATIRVMDKAIDEVHDRLAFVTDPGVLGDATIELHAITAKLDGLRAKLSAQAAANGVPQSAGVRTIGQFVGSQTNRSPQRANTDARFARWLAGFPTIADAYYTGQITADHVKILRRLDTPRSNAQLFADQELLVDAAVGVLCFANFEKVVAYWVNKHDPDGKEPKDQIETFGVQFRPGSGGRGTVVADLDAVSYSALKTMVEHRVKALRERMPAQGTAMTSLRQDRGSALMSLLVDGFARPDGTLPIPIVNLIMSEKVAEWAIERLLNPDSAEPFETVPVDAFDIDGRCELIDGTPIHPFLAVAMSGLWRLGAPVMRRYVMNAKSRIVDYSYNARVAPEHLRTASMIEHRSRCTIPGCDAPHHWLQVDHQKPSSKGGETALPNLKPMCEADNLAKGDGPGFHHPPGPPPDEPDEPD